MTRVRLLFDEDVPAALYLGLRRRQPGCEILWIGTRGAPEKGTTDPDVLSWCEKHGWLLVTLDGSTMPAHLGRHLQSGGHTPGVLVVPRQGVLACMLDDLLLIVDASNPEDWRDRAVHLPL